MKFSISKKLPKQANHQNRKLDVFSLRGRQILRLPIARLHYIALTIILGSCTTKLPPEQVNSIPFGEVKGESWISNPYNNESYWMDKPLKAGTIYRDKSAPFGTKRYYRVPLDLEQRLAKLHSKWQTNLDTEWKKQQEEISKSTAIARSRSSDSFGAYQNYADSPSDETASTFGNNVGFAGRNSRNAPNSGESFISNGNTISISPPSGKSRPTGVWSEWRNIGNSSDIRYRLKRVSETRDYTELIGQYSNHDSPTYRYLIDVVNNTNTRFTIKMKILQPDSISRLMTLQWHDLIDVDGNADNMRGFGDHRADL